MKRADRPEAGKRERRRCRAGAVAGSVRRPFAGEQLEARLLLAVGFDPLISPQSDLVAVPLVESLAFGAIDAEPQAGSASPTGYTPDEIRHAYAYDEIYLAGGTIQGDGSGETIAIVNAFHTPTALSDLTAFSNYWGLPMPPSFVQVDQNGGTNYPGSNSGWAKETALDIQWAHALAPGANILLVEAQTASFADLGIALDYARSQPGVSAISMSWGALEFASETLYDAHFATPNEHANVTFFAAAGNNGAPGLYPAYSPDVMASGGTTLTLDEQGNTVLESSWNGSGGGISQYEAQPPWQSGVVTQSTTMRTMPDVALNANPNSGVSIYDTYNNPVSTPWTTLAGTSFTAPAWAALVTIANQGRNLVGLPVLDIPELMTAIYTMPQSNFHDITSNGGPPANPPAVGYDLVTGRGTPIGDLIVEYLVGLGSVSGTVFDDVNGNTVLDSELGLAGWTVYADLDADATFDPLAVNSFASTDVPKNIGSSGPNTVTSNLSVTGLTGRVIDVNVSLNISHARLSDLELTLIAPDGTRVTLAAGEGQAGNNFAGTTFDDSAPVSISVGTGQFSGSYHPTGSLLDLFAKNPNGTWQLEVKDTVLFFGGTLNSWSLEVSSGDPNAISAADGSYYIDALPAGAYDFRQIDQSPYTQTAPAGGFYTVNVAFAGHSTGLDFGNQAPASAAPTSVTLLAASDTGISSSDQITKLNNSSGGAALQFDVSGTIAGATVTLYSDGTPIGSAVAAGTTTTVTTDGSTTLADSTRTITARQTEPGFSESGDSAPLAVEIDTQAPAATLVPATPDPRTTPVAQMTITFDEQVVGLELVDLSLTRDAGPNLLSAAQTVTSGDGITWTLADLTALTGTPGYYELVMSPAVAPLTDVAGNVNSDVESTSFTFSATVLGRFVFYNNSQFDGNDPAISASDDAAIDTIKSAYLPGSGPATFANTTSYTRGINGIAIDIDGSHPSISASDFVFKVGNNNTPSTWAAAPAANNVSVRVGAGASGSDRVEITWADGAIKDTWLEVQVLANGNTGLADLGGGIGDVFFFGNKVGNSTGDLLTSVGDAGAVFSNLGTATVTNLYDYDKTGVVNVADGGIVFGSLGSIAAIDIDSGGPFAPQDGGNGGGEVVPSVSESSPAVLAAALSQSASGKSTRVRAATHPLDRADFSVLLAGSTTRAANRTNPLGQAGRYDLFGYRLDQLGASREGTRPSFAATAAWRDAFDDGAVERYEDLDEDLLDLLAADFHAALCDPR